MSAKSGVNPRLSELRSDALPAELLAESLCICDQYLANIFRGRIEHEMIYSLRGAKHRVDYSVHIR